MATGAPRGWVRLAGVLAVLVVVGAAVLGVRQLRDEPVPVSTRATTGTPTSVPAPTPRGGSSATSPDAPAAPGRAPSSADRTPAATPSAPSLPSATATATEPPGGAPGPDVDVSTKPPVPLDDSREVDEGLIARVSALEAVAGEASGPGEVAGPAVRVTLTLTNRSGGPFDLTSTVVNLYHGADETPGPALSGPGTRALPSSVAPGVDATGTFVFAVPEEARSDVLVTVDYSADTPVVAFRGSGPL